MKGFPLLMALGVAVLVHAFLGCTTPVPVVEPPTPALEPPATEAQMDPSGGGIGNAKPVPGEPTPLAFSFPLSEDARRRFRDTLGALRGHNAQVKAANETAGEAPGVQAADNIASQLATLENRIERRGTLTE